MQHYNQGYDELYHYGVMGMRWGRRIARGHGGPGKYITKNSQLKGDQKDLDYLNKGGHLSVGLTKKRQEAYDTRDKAKIEKRISENQKSKKIGPVGSTLVKGTASLHKGLAKIDRSAANASKRDAESIRSQKSQMLALTKNGKPLFSEKDVDNMIKAYDSNTNKSESKAKKHERYANQLLSELGKIKVKDL